MNRDEETVLKEQIDAILSGEHELRKDDRIPEPEKVKDEAKKYD